MNAEGWLVREKDILDRSRRTGERWKPPSERDAEQHAGVLLLSQYGKTWIEQRKLAPTTRREYEAKWAQLIEPHLGAVAVRDLTAVAVRGWFAGLDQTKATRNKHAYSVLSAICNTAIKDGLLERNPCDIAGVMNSKPKRNVNRPGGQPQPVGEDHRGPRQIPLPGRGVVPQLGQLRMGQRGNRILVAPPWPRQPAPGHGRRRTRLG
jgi:hypothetical protein